jgi:hypothetical protein
LLPTGIVYVAGLASTALSLSVAVNVNVTGPVYVPLGSNFKLKACAGVSTCPAVTAVVPSARYKMPWAAGGKVETVKLEIVPSVSVATSGSIAVAAAVLEMLAFVTSVATGGLLPTGIVYVAGVLSIALELSVAVKVNVTFPVNEPLGSNFKLEACAGVKT